MKCMETWYKASTSGYCSRELKRNSTVVYSLHLAIDVTSVSATGNYFTPTQLSLTINHRKHKPKKITRRHKRGSIGPLPSTFDIYYSSD